MQEQQATVRGVPMRWTEAGEGFPVVLVHGIPTSPALWRHVLPRVRGGRWLAFELVGYGNSIPAGRDRDLSVARQADYLLGWLEQLGVERAVLVGHDLGGGVAQIAAVRQPRRCAGLVLTNSVCYDSWPIPSVRALRAARPLVGRLPMPAFKVLVGSLLGLTGPGGAFQEVTVTLGLRSPAPAERVRQLVAHAERGCHAAQSLRAAVPVHLLARLNGDDLAG